MKKWKYEIMAGTLLLPVSIRIYEIEIGTLVGLVCLIRGLEELYRQTGDQRFRYAWMLSLVLLAGGVLLAVTLGILIRDCNVIRDVPAE